MERVEFSRHHTIFTRREQTKTRSNRLLRGHPSLVIPLPTELHKELHANIGPPIVPSKTLADVLIHEANTHAFNPNTFSYLLSVLHELSERDTALSDEAYKLGSNLLRQAEIMQPVYNFQLRAVA